MWLNNELKALRGCDFHAWKQIEHSPALCVYPLMIIVTLFLCGLKTLI